MSKKNTEKGFTLIELLTVIGILGVLTGLSLVAFSKYRANAAFASVESTIRDSGTDLIASIINPDTLPGGVAMVNQRVPGPLSDGSAASLLPATKVPRGISFSVSFDPGCNAGGCQSAFLEARHEHGEKYKQWVRFGDGLIVPAEFSGRGW